MEKIKDLLKIENKKKKAPTYEWQEKALIALDFFVDGNSKKSSVFRCFKKNKGAAQIALNDCQELSKPFVKYFLKVYNSINNMQKTKINLSPVSSKFAKSWKELKNQNKIYEKTTFTKKRRGLSPDNR